MEAVQDIPVTIHTIIIQVVEAELQISVLADRLLLTDILLQVVAVEVDVLVVPAGDWMVVREADLQPLTV